MKTLSFLLALCILVVVYGRTEPVGGYKAVSTTDPEVQSVAAFAWQQVSVADSRVNLTSASNLVVLTAAKQLVNGLNFKLGLTGEFSGVQISVDCVVYKSFAGDMSLTSYTVTTNAMGGYKPISTSDKEVQAVSRFALGEIASKDNRITLSDVVDFEIVSAYQQIVNGKNYKLVMTGKFSGIHTTIDCVVYRSLAGEFNLTSYVVAAASSFAVLDAGGYEPIDTDDLAVRFVAMMAVEQIATEDNRLTLDNVTNFEVVSAYQQIVNGKNYKLEMTGEFSGVQTTIDCVAYVSLEGAFNLTSYSINTVNFLAVLDDGGWEPANVSDTKVQFAAMLAVEGIAAVDNQLDLDDVENFTIVSAYQQIVAGINYKLEITGSFTGVQTTVDCVVYESLDGNFSVTSFTVNINNPVAALDVGGYEPVDTSDPNVQTVATFVWGEVAALDSRVDLNEGANLEVVTAFQQVVAGKNYKLELTGDFNGIKITINSVVYQSLAGDLNLTSYTVSTASLVGGYDPIGITDPVVQAAASFAWGEIAAQDSRVNLNAATDLEVVSAFQQIVNGKNLKLEMTGVFNGTHLSVECIVYQSLDGNMSLTDYSVSDDTTMPGGFQPVDPSSADVQDVANWLWKQLAQVKGSGVDLTVGTNLEVVSAETQVVAGMNYQLRVTGTFGTEQILCDALIYKDLQGNYSLSSYDIHESNGVIM